jgi:hypothetical protein
MSEWVPLTVTEVKLLRLMEEGFLLPKEVARWRAAADEAFSDSWPDGMVSFINFHERGFGISMLDFLHGFLHEYGVQL